MKKKTLIIAEAGVNHNGKISNAFKMIDLAAKSGADFIKFQMFIPENLSQKKMNLAKYQKKNSKFLNQLDMLKKYSLSYDDLKKIKARCIRKKIKFMASPFDEQSAMILKKMKPRFIKIPSGEITNIPLLRLIGKFKIKVIISTGMSKLDEIKNAISILTNSGLKKKNISILHCSTEYPANISKLNLLSIKYLSEKLKIQVGYSDHSQGSEASIMAISLGAKIIEKHFTLNKKMKGPDHSSSLSPLELYKFVKKIRCYEKSLGKYEKKPYFNELKNLNIVRKQIVAKRQINKGERFSILNITTKRAKKGIPASNWDKIIGKKSKFNFYFDDNIKI